MHGAPHNRSRVAIGWGYVIAALLALTGLLTADATPSLAGGGMCHGTEFTKTITSGEGLTNEIRGNCYMPTVLHVQPGDTVTWTNRDNVPHTVTGTFGTWGSYTQFGLDQSVRFEFEGSGTFPYFCAVHPLMQGVVVVGDGRAANPHAVAQKIVHRAVPAPDAPAASPSPVAPSDSSELADSANPAGWALGGFAVGALIAGAGLTLGRGRRGVSDR